MARILARAFRAALYALFLFCSARTGFAQDAVIQNAVQSAMETVSAAKLEAPEAARLYALTAIALHDGYYIAQGRPGYLSGISVDKTLPPREVMAAAAQAVLAQNYPNSISPSPQDPAAQGITSPLALELGARIAKDLTGRLPLPATISFQPFGDWQPPKGQEPVLPNWRYARPLTLSYASQFRPNGPPEPGSAAYQNMLDEVLWLGEDVSDARSADASFTARFWKAPAGTPTPPGHWNRIALETGGGLDTHAMLSRLLALNIALYDTGIAAWDCKYTFQFVRPDAAIPARDVTRKTWIAMGETPAHPEYVSGHSAFSAAAGAVLTAFDGEISFCTTNPDAFNVRRCYPSYKAAAEEAGMSRIYGGIHFSPSNHDGLKLGRDVAGHVLKTLRTRGLKQDGHQDQKSGIE